MSMDLSGRPAYRANQKGTQTRFDRWIHSARTGLEGVLSIMAKHSGAHTKWSIFGMWFDFFQLIAYPLYGGKTFPWAKMKVMAWLISFLGILNPSGAADTVSPIFKLSLVFAAALWVLLIVAAAGWSAYSFSTSNFSTILPLKFLSATARLTTTALFVPLATLLISVYKCKRGDTWNRSEIACYGLEHGLLMAMVSILLPCFWIFSLCVSAVFFDRNYLSGNITARTHGRVGIMMISIKSSLTLIFTVAQDADPWFLHIVVIALGVLWLWLYLRFLPNFTQTMNQIWSAFGAVFLWAGLCAALARVLNDPYAGVAGYVFFIGVPTAAYTGYALAYMRFQSFGRVGLPGGPIMRTPYDVELRARYILRDVMAAGRAHEHRGHRGVQAAGHAGGINSHSNAPHATHHKHQNHHLHMSEAAESLGVSSSGHRSSSSDHRRNERGGTGGNSVGSRVIRTRAAELTQEEIQSAISEVETLYDRASYIFPNSSLLSLFHAQFLRCFMNEKEKELHIITTGLTKDPSVDIRFVLTQAKEALENETSVSHGAASHGGGGGHGGGHGGGGHGHHDKHGKHGHGHGHGGGKLSLIDLVQSDKLGAESTEFSTRARTCEFEFWSALRAKQPDLGRLHSLAEEMSNSIAKATSSFEKLLTLQPDNVEVLQSYATFLMQVKREIAPANKYFEQADEIMAQREAAAAAAAAAAAKKEEEARIAAETDKLREENEASATYMQSTNSQQQQQQQQKQQQQKQQQQQQLASSAREYMGSQHAASTAAAKYAAHVANARSLSTPPGTSGGRNSKKQKQQRLGKNQSSRSQSTTPGNGSTSLYSPRADGSGVMPSSLSIQSGSTSKQALSLASSKPRSEMDSHMLGMSKRRGSVALAAYSAAISKMRRQSLVMQVTENTTHHAQRRASWVLNGPIVNTPLPEDHGKNSATGGKSDGHTQRSDSRGRSRGRRSSLEMGGQGRSGSMEHPAGMNRALHIKNIAGGEGRVIDGRRESDIINTTNDPRQHNNSSEVPISSVPRFLRGFPAEKMQGEREIRRKVAGEKALAQREAARANVVALEQEKAARAMADRRAAFTERAKEDARRRRLDSAETTAASLRQAINSRAASMEPSLISLVRAITIFFVAAAIIDVVAAAVQRWLLTGIVEGVDLLRDSSTRSLMVEDVVHATSQLELFSSGRLAYTEADLNATYEGLRESTFTLDELHRRLYLATDESAVATSSEADLYNIAMLTVEDVSYNAAGNEVVSLRDVSLSNLGIEFISKAALVYSLPLANITAVNPSVWYILRNGPASVRYAMNMSNVYLADGIDAHDSRVRLIDLYFMAVSCLVFGAISVIVVFPIVLLVKRDTDGIFAIFLNLPDNILQQMESQCKAQIDALRQIEQGNAANADLALQIAMQQPGVGNDENETDDDLPGKHSANSNNEDDHIDSKVTDGSDDNTSVDGDDDDDVKTRDEEGGYGQSRGSGVSGSEGVGGSHTSSNNNLSSSFSHTPGEGGSENVRLLPKFPGRNPNFNARLASGPPILAVPAFSANAAATQAANMAMEQAKNSGNMTRQPSALNAIKSNAKRAELIRVMSHALLPNARIGGDEFESGSQNSGGLLGNRMPSFRSDGGSSYNSFGSRRANSFFQPFSPRGTGRPTKKFKKNMFMGLKLLLRFTWPLFLLLAFYAGVWRYEDETSGAVSGYKRDAYYFEQVDSLLGHVNHRIRSSLLSVTQACNLTAIDEAAQFVELTTSTINSFQDDALYGTNGKRDSNSRKIPGSYVDESPPTLSSSEELQRIMLTNGCTPPKMPEDCSSREQGFYHGLLADGLQAALREYNMLARHVLQVHLADVAKAVTSNTTCPLVDSSDPAIASLDSLAQNYMRVGFRYVSDLMVELIDARIAGFLGVHAALTTITIFILLIFYFVFFMRAIRKMDRDIKRTRGTLLLFPTDVLAGVAAFVQMNGAVGVNVDFGLRSNTKRSLSARSGDGDEDDADDEYAADSRAAGQFNGQRLRPNLIGRMR